MLHLLCCFLKGYSRIPVYEKKRDNIVSILYIKDLAFVDPNDVTDIKVLVQHLNNKCYFVFDDLTLDVLFRKFRDGNFGHMAFVQRINTEGDGDPFYQTMGLVTMEDVIEEILQCEINDETDVFSTYHSFLH